MTVPRRTPPTHTERVRVVTTRTAPGSLLGGTRMAKPLATPKAPRTVAGNVVVVIHGDDPDVPRPSATIVMWVGAASPGNAVEFDFWYAATL